MFYATYNGYDVYHMLISFAFLARLVLWYPMYVTLTVALFKLSFVSPLTYAIYERVRYLSSQSIWLAYLERKDLF